MSPTGRRTPPSEKAPWILETIGVLLLVPNMLLSAALTGRSAPSASALFGVMLAPAFIGLIVVGIASLFSGARNRRTRAKIFLVRCAWCSWETVGTWVPWPAAGS